MPDVVCTLRNKANEFYAKQNHVRVAKWQTTKVQVCFPTGDDDELDGPIIDENDEVMVTENEANFVQQEAA